MIKKHSGTTSKFNRKEISIFEVLSKFIDRAKGLISQYRINILRKIKIRWRLIIAFLLLSFGPLLILGFSSFNSTRSALSDTIKQYNSQVVTQFGVITSNQMKKNMETVNSFAFSTLAQDSFSDFETMEMVDKIAVNNVINKEFVAITSQNPSLSGMVFYLSSGGQRFMAGTIYEGEYDTLNQQLTDSDVQSVWFVNEDGELVFARKVINVQTGKHMGNIMAAITPSSIDTIFDGFNLGESVDI